MNEKEIAVLIKKAVCELPENEISNIQDVCTFEEEGLVGNGVKLFLMNGKRFNIEVQEHER